MLAAAALAGWPGGSAGLPHHIAIVWGTPQIVVPRWSEFWRSFEIAVVPQLALTLTNAVIVTASLARELFPDARAAASERKLALSSGVANLVLAPLGAMPMCHGAGGLQAQYRFGSRTGLAPIILGAVLLVLAVAFSTSAARLFAITPIGSVGALLILAGADLAMSRRLFDAKPSCWPVIGTTALLTFAREPGARPRRRLDHRTRSRGARAPICCDREGFFRMTGPHPMPPRTPTEPIEVGPGDWAARDFYLLMTALVIPRPIGWISTVSAAGGRNLAPYSYFNLMGSDPFYVAFGSTTEKDTVSNLRQVPEFVANIVTMHLLERMNFTSTDFPHAEDEFLWAGLTPVPAAKVRPWRVGEAKAHLECEVVQIVDDRNTHIVLGRIVHAHVDPSVWRDGPVDPKLLDPVCRLAGSGYARLGELLAVQRLVWSAVQGTHGQDAMPRAVKRQR